MNTPPSRYVQPEVREARVERLWQNVSHRLEARPSRVWRWVVLSSALAAGAAGAVLWLKMPATLNPAFENRPIISGTLAPAISAAKSQP